MKDITDIDDPRVVKALAHPLRVRILGILEHRTASPSEIAAELDLPLGNVSYHVRILLEYGLIKLVRRTPRRGAIEHHYEAVGRLRFSDEAWGQAPGVVKEAFVAAILKQVADYVNAAAAGGGFDDPHAHIMRSPLVLDQEGWLALSKALSDLHDRAEAIQTESIKRLKRANHDHEIATGVVLMLFQGQDFGSQVRSAPRAARPRVRKVKARAS